MRVPARISLAGKVIVLVAVVVVGLTLTGRWPPTTASAADPEVVVQRGALTVDLSVNGVLQPAESITYRSPLIGRETEITFMVPEGLSVREGDLLIRLDSTELSAELARAEQARREAAIAVELARLDVQQAKGDADTSVDGEGALAVEEAQINLKTAERRLERLRSESNDLKPLLDRGFVTKEELDRAELAADEAEGAAQLARRRALVLTSRSQPRARSRAELALAQKRAQLENAKQKAAELDASVESLRGAIAGCSLYATKPGLVVYEDYSAASPTRKIRPGDRVTSTQGIISIPEVARMQLLSSVREADVHLVQIGQRADVAVESYPDRRLTGRLVSIGTVARTSVEHPQDEKRFDVALDIGPTDVPLRPQMTGRADIHIAAEKNALLVPINAIYDEHGETVVYVGNRSGQVGRRPIKVGRSDGVHALVIEGVREGDHLRLLGPDRRP